MMHVGTCENNVLCCMSAGSHMADLGSGLLQPGMHNKAPLQREGQLPLGLSLLLLLYS